MPARSVGTRSSSSRPSAQKVTYRAICIGSRYAPGLLACIRCMYLRKSSHWLLSQYASSPSQNCCRLIHNCRSAVHGFLPSPRMRMLLAMHLWLFLTCKAWPLSNQRHSTSASGTSGIYGPYQDVRSGRLSLKPFPDWCSRWNACSTKLMVPD